MDTKSLKQKILDLAIRGKLVPQNPNDEPASVLLQRIRAEREQLIAQGKIKRSKTTSDNQHYENVPFEIPATWAWVELNELAQYKKGPFGSSLTKAMFVPKGDTTFKVYEQKNAIQKDDTLGTYYISDSHFEQLKGFEVFPEDIIVSCAGTIGETYVMPQYIQRGIINQALMYIRLYYKDITDFYLIYFDSIIKGNSQNDSKGTAMKNIPPFEILKKYLMPLPPLAEQKRIIAEIKKWFALIDEIETSKQDLHETIKQAKSKILSLAISGKLVAQDPNDEPAIDLLRRINPSFKPCDTSHYENLPQGWTISTVGEVATYINGRAFKPSEWEQNGLPIIRIQNLNDSDAPYNYSSATYETKYLVKDGDLLFAWAASLGTYIWNGGNAWLNQHIFKVEPKEFIDKYFLYYSLVNLIAEFYRQTHGSGMVHITKGKFENTPILIPPLAEQKRIVVVLEKIYYQLDKITAEL